MDDGDAELFAEEEAEEGVHSPLVCYRGFACANCSAAAAAWRALRREEVARAALA